MIKTAKARGGVDMREIKFRGKTANREWVYGSLTYSDNIEPAIYFEVGKGTVKAFDFVYVIPETVGQFTGLHDKNGKMIFEGDAVECHAIQTTEVVIVEDIRKIPVQFRWVDIYDGATIKVIGNIHDKEEDV